MIISASRRTDIPAFYFEWFLNRLREGTVLIPNPRNADRIGRVALSPDNVDCIVFWTKNPLPMLSKMEQLDRLGYAYYIHFTLTPYKAAVERSLPQKEILMAAFRQLSTRVGAQRVIWRYDPVFIDRHHSVPWHVGQFKAMCERLHGYTERCIISFIDPYDSIRAHFSAMTSRESQEIAFHFSKIAQSYGMKLYTCAEEMALERYGIGHAACIDQGLIEQVTGRRIATKKDGNQRSSCRCIASVDIGAYDTCPHGCAYCYATSNAGVAARCVAAHDPHAPMIIGYPVGNEIITERTVPSQVIHQMKMF